MVYGRGRFLRNVVRLGIALAFLAVPFVGCPDGVYAFNQSPQIPLFQTTLRGVGPGAIPVAAPGANPAPVTGVMHYDIDISQFTDQILPPTVYDSNNQPYASSVTTLWGYNPVNPLGGGIQPQKHLGGIIVGKGRNPNDPMDKNVPIQITFRNRLNVSKHILPVDTTQQEPGDVFNATAVHLHGGLVPWISDGGPFDFFTPTGAHGLSFLNNDVLNPQALPGQAEYYYPLNQSARFMWYHDHAHGVTRLNAYAGIASGMLIRDKFEANLVATKGLPPYIETSVLGGKTVQELPIVIQDKIFVDAANIAANDQGWSGMVQPAAAAPGSLWYAHTYEVNQQDGTGRWDQFPGAPTPPDPSVVPEFFGDTMLVNGTVYPEATVQARRYRLRFLNACNARFVNLQLYIADDSPEGITLDQRATVPDGNGGTIPNPNYGHPTNTPFANAATGDSSWLQIGTEGGFLSKPTKVPSNQPFGFKGTYQPDPNTGQTDPSKVLKSLIVAPAERPDVIVDFKNASGTKVVLYNDAPAPFPVGDDRNDYFPGWNTLGADGTIATAGLFGVGNPVNQTTQPGNGPNTRVLMRFNVVAATGPADPQLGITTSTDLTKGIDPSLNPWGATSTPGVFKRFLTLNEYFDDFGRLIQIIGDQGAPYGSPLIGSATYLGYGPTGATQSVGSTEENVTAGTTEIWEIYNTTGDVHPMHFHLVNVQLINRQLFTGDPASQIPVVLGDLLAADPNEQGWKETVPMYPGTVTRVIMKFDVQGAKIVGKNLKPVTYPQGNKTNQFGIAGGNPPVSPRTGGYEYVWHCHILEHEEHDMMHTLVVKGVRD